jgi:hypothetical protein
MELQDGRCFSTFVDGHGWQADRHEGHEFSSHSVTCKHNARIQGLWNLASESRSSLPFFPIQTLTGAFQRVADSPPEIAHQAQSQSQHYLKLEIEKLKGLE